MCLVEENKLMLQNMRVFQQANSNVNKKRKLEKRKEIPEHSVPKWGLPQKWKVTDDKLPGKLHSTAE